MITLPAVVCTFLVAGLFFQFDLLCFVSWIVGHVAVPVGLCSPSSSSSSFHQSLSCCWWFKTQQKMLDAYYSVNQIRWAKVLGRVTDGCSLVPRRLKPNIQRITSSKRRLFYGVMGLTCKDTAVTGQITGGDPTGGGVRTATSPSTWTRRGEEESSATVDSGSWSAEGRHLRHLRVHITWTLNITQLVRNPQLFVRRLRKFGTTPSASSCTSVEKITVLSAEYLPLQSCLHHSGSSQCGQQRKGLLEKPKMILLLNQT